MERPIKRALYVHSTTYNIYSTFAYSAFYFKIIIYINIIIIKLRMCTRVRDNSPRNHSARDHWYSIPYVNV